jgi:DNA-binding Lrp family transcriptional regulator
MPSVRVPDVLDRRILDELRRDARASYRAIARRAGSTTPTVSARVRRMVAIGLIAGYRVLVRGLPEPAAPQTPWRCIQCRGPFHGAALVMTARGRHYAFCCKGCQSAFMERLERLGGPSA